MKSLAFFSNKSGVGSTTLLFNVAHMMALKGLRVVILDYDPQCEISVMALGEEPLFTSWELSQTTTVAHCVEPVRRGKGDVIQPELIDLSENLWLLPGDLALSRFESTLVENWERVHQSDNWRALHVTTALHRLAESAAKRVRADVILIDAGPNLGALNRAVLLATDALVVPVAPDPFGLHGLKTLGPVLRDWREDWRRATERLPEPTQARSFEPRGYIVEQYYSRPRRDGHWVNQLPLAFHRHVLSRTNSLPDFVDDDPYCIATLKYFASLVPLAQLARKPLFDLKQADGIGRGQLQAVARARTEFEELVKKLRVLLQL